MNNDGKIMTRYHGGEDSGKGKAMTVVTLHRLLYPLHKLRPFQRHYSDVIFDIAIVEEY